MGTKAHFCWETQRRRDNLDKVDVDGRKDFSVFIITLLIIRLRKCGLSLSGLGQRHLADRCEDGNDIFMR